MHDECLGLEIDAPRGGSAGIGCGGDIDWAGGVVAAKRKVADQAAIEIEVGSESARASLRGGGYPDRPANSNRTAAEALQFPRCPTTKTRRRRWGTPKY